MTPKTLLRPKEESRNCTDSQRVLEVKVSIVSVSLLRIKVSHPSTDQNFRVLGGRPSPTTKEHVIVSPTAPQSLATLSKKCKGMEHRELSENFRI